MSINTTRTYSATLNSVEQALFKQWKKDNPGLVDAPVKLSASQIRAAATQAKIEGNPDFDANGRLPLDPSKAELAKVLDDMASKLEKSDRTLDIDGDGKLEVGKGFIAVSPGQDIRTELDKYGGVEDLMGANGDIKLSVTENSGNTNGTGSTNKLIRQFLQLISGLFGGNNQGSGGGILLVLLLLLGLGNNNKIA